MQYYGVCEGIPEVEWFEMMKQSGKDVYHYTPEGAEPSESVHQRLTDFFWVRNARLLRGTETSKKNDVLGLRFSALKIQFGRYCYLVMVV